MGVVVESGRMLAGRYRLIARLGRGGFGEVWRAEDAVLDRMVAVKSLTVAADGALVGRFVREARALARLDHPNVVAVYDTGTEDGVDYVVMQLLAGPSLAALLAEQRPLPLADALEYAAQAAAGLAAAHDAGIVHRDVSPANLILDGAGTLKLVDFGVARLEGVSTELTATGTVFATAGYVSPEQAEGRPADARSDLYSLGCVLYALLAGRPPFTAEHPIGVIQQHLSSPPPALPVAAPPPVGDLLASLLAKDPGRRPSSAEHVRRRLDEIRSPAAATIPLTQVRRRRPRTGRLIAGLGLLLLAVGGVLAATLPGGGARGTAPPSPAATPTAPTTTAPTTTAPTTTAPTTTAPTTTKAAAPPPVPQTPQQALAAERAAVASAQADGQLDPAAAGDLGHRLDDVARALAHPNPNAAAQKVGDLQHRVDDLVRHGQLSSAGLALIGAPLNRLAALLPSAGEGHEHG
jgi:eukaryotic-like serine/threonine-protein kinase